MPHQRVHAVVTAVARTGSQQLARRAAAGAAVPFELVETPSEHGGAPMFSYRPLTLDFVEEQLDVLRAIDAWPVAVNVLAGFDGLGDYLQARGERQVPADARERAERVLVVMLATMHAETGDFLVTPERTAAAADGVARTVLSGRLEAVVVVPLLGVRLDTPRLELQPGLTLLRDDIIDGLPRAARSGAHGRPGTLAVVTSSDSPSTAAAVAAARPRLHALLRALRLYDRPAPALAPMAWSRTRGGGWAPHPFVGTFARAAGTLELAAEDGDGLRGFLELLAGMPLTGRAGWAARRHELACERSNPAEALTDVLLALRALVPEQQDQPFAARVAELCAAAGDREALQRRVEQAEAVEFAIVEGDQLDHKQLAITSEELRWHLRALLRDIACGHLPADLDDVEPSSATDAAIPSPPTTKAGVEVGAAIGGDGDAAMDVDVVVSAAAPAAVGDAPGVPQVAAPSTEAFAPPFAGDADDRRDGAVPVDASEVLAVAGGAAAGPSSPVHSSTANESHPEESPAAARTSVATADHSAPELAVTAADDESLDDAFADLDIDITDARSFADPARDVTDDGEPFEAAFVRSLDRAPQPLPESAALRAMRARVSRPRVRRRGR